MALKSGGSGGFKFKYQRRDPSVWREKSKESASNFDQYIISGIERYAVRDGLNKIRILPPTWENADDWSYPIWMHYGVGADKQSYLCLKKMKGEYCPVCAEVARLAHEGDLDDSKSLNAKRRAACWIIDRKNEEAGLQFWAMPFSLAKDMLTIAQDEELGVLEFDNPDAGYDVNFKREGEGLKTQYGGLKLARSPSAIFEDEREQAAILQYITEHPIPDVLKFYDANHIKDILEGQVDMKEPEDEDESNKSVKEKPKSHQMKVIDVDEEEDEPDLDDEDYGEEVVDEDEDPTEHLKRVSRRNR